MKTFGAMVSRRLVIKTLALWGASASLASGLVAQVRRAVTPEALDAATALLDQEFTEERLDVIAPALQRNLDQFQIVRDLEIDDLIEPATTFDASWR